MWKGEVMTNRIQRMTRRSFVASGAVAMAGVGYARRLEAAELTAQEKANVQVVTDFCAAWSARDLTKIMSCFAESGVYRATETAEPVKGRDAVTARVRGFLDRVERFDVLDTFARGPMVINERIDRFSSGTLKAWHGVGVFFLKDGKIVEWYDYTMSTERA
jgi:limonene-1,2-epoxide hydrolase